jgi:pimeloyl-ACP methyl ester carboxylesterase
LALGILFIQIDLPEKEKNLFCYLSSGEVCLKKKRIGPCTWSPPHTPVWWRESVVVTRSRRWYSSRAHGIKSCLLSPSLRRWSVTIASGIGESDLARSGRNGDDLVDDLAKLLYNIGTSAPYILVGNSLGGQIIRYFTHLHHKDVVGMVLLDSTHHNQHRQALALMPPPSPEDNPDFITLRRNLTNLMDGIINDPEQDLRRGLPYL